MHYRQGAWFEPCSTHTYFHSNRADLVRELSVTDERRHTRSTGMKFNSILPRKSAGTKIFQYCTCPAGRVTQNFHWSCKHMHLSFKSVCNKEHKGVICNMTSSRNSSQRTRPTGRVLWNNYLFFLDLTRNYERMSEFFVP